jgi:antitoxin CptB
MDRDAIERLKWRSRRGLLELDLVFGRFWAGEGARLTAGEARALATLLELPDNDLLDLVMGRTQPPEDGTGAMIEKLRAA